LLKFESNVYVVAMTVKLFRTWTPVRYAAGND